MKASNNKNLKTKMPVYGMTCSACKSKVEKSLERLSGVKSAKVSLKNKEAIIIHSQSLAKKDLKSAIDASGYSVSKQSATKQGLLYGLLPHAGCIFFIVASVFGATFFMNLLRPLMMSSLFFYALIFISVLFATISALIYLKRNGLLNFDGVRRQKKYLATLYGVTIAINLALFLIIFPLSANFASASSSTANEDSGVFEMEVVIPCSGHAPLIINEVSVLEGVQEVRYSFPYKFTVKYDERVTSPEKILEADIFVEFPATYEKTFESQSISLASNADNDLENSNSACKSCFAEDSACGGDCSGACDANSATCVKQEFCQLS